MWTDVLPEHVMEAIGVLPTEAQEFIFSNLYLGLQNFERRAPLDPVQMEVLSEFITSLSMSFVSYHINYHKTFKSEIEALREEVERVRTGNRVIRTLTRWVK